MDKNASKTRPKGPVARPRAGAPGVGSATVKRVDADDLTIVGLGASAGGLEAFEQFFRNVRPDSGFAFVLVQHLDPGHASILTEILQRCTAMPVVEAKDQMAVAANHVYVIPPNCEMTIFRGALHLSTPELPRGHRLPIDAFLRSLAEEQGEKAIGIVLSGTGTDGTLGLRAILGAGGVSFVQEPETAKFDGMPTSAIAAGWATHVLPAAKMPDALRNARRSVTPTAGGMTASGINHILALVRSDSGHDFSRYKKSTIGRRIERRMLQHDIEDTDVYARYLKEHPTEAQSLFNELLINVTSFFRDPEAFETLRKEVLPELLAGKQADYVFRIWVAGCATGEETYSIAMVLREFLAESLQEVKVQIYSTDLSADAIGTARAGVYPPNIEQDVSPERLQRFFLKEESGYRVKKELREMVVFAIQNVIKDPHFTKLDFISCRNLMIYLEPELQEHLIPTFHRALKPGGVLFLSPSESIGGYPSLFVPISRKWKFYRAAPATIPAGLPGALGMPWPIDDREKHPEAAAKNRKGANFAELAKGLLLDSYAPASVISDLEGNILYVHGETGHYLRPAPGQATLNVIEMAREELQFALRSAVQAAAARGTSTIGRELSLKTAEGAENISFSVRVVQGPDHGQGLLLLSFQDLPHPAPAKPARGRHAKASPSARQIEQLERELAYTKQNLHATIEEQQASNEELKSTNEEMQSTNEELQSTNEELETSKEELQSVNEELVTVNSELQAKIEQLAEMQNDMKNLLDNISIGTVFLDEHLVIRRFTREAVQIYHLVESDVGRPLGDIKAELEGEDLVAASRAVLDTLSPFEREVRTHDGAWYLARIQPYRTLDNVIAGVVLTFVGITAMKRAQAALDSARELSAGIVDTVREPLIVLDGAMCVVTASRSFYRRFHVKPEETVGRRLYELGDRQWDVPPLRDLLENVLPRDRSFDNFPVEHEFPFIGRRRIHLSARRILGKPDDAPLILLAMEMSPLSEQAGT